MRCLTPGNFTTRPQHKECVTGSCSCWKLRWCDQWSNDRVPHLVILMLFDVGGRRGVRVLCKHVRRHALV